LNKGENKLKKFTAILLTLIIAVLSTGSISASAAIVPPVTQTQIEYLDNGDYVETVISDVPTDNATISVFSTTKTITKTKTTYYKNSSGAVMWYIRITATFTYNGSTSKCTSCSHSASAPGTYWSIKSVSSSKSGNSATAKAVATYKTGLITHDYSASVTIKCSANGTVS